MYVCASGRTGAADARVNERRVFGTFGTELLPQSLACCFAGLCLVSGLPVSDAKQAIYLIASELTTEQWKEQTWYIHDACRTRGKLTDDIHLLPSYDEYLLGYKDRTDVLPLEHYPKAFTNNGLFFPIILHKGQVVGNWNKSAKKKGLDLEYSCFRQEADMDEAMLHQAKQKFAQFLGK